MSLTVSPLFVVCVGADGQVRPPLIIYPRKRIHPTVIDNAEKVIESIHLLLVNQTQVSASITVSHLCIL